MIVNYIVQVAFFWYKLILWYLQHILLISYIFITFQLHFM
jgi:hypothetical protein